MAFDGKRQPLTPDAPQESPRALVLAVNSGGAPLIPAATRGASDGVKPLGSGHQADEVERDDAVDQAGSTPRRGRRRTAPSSVSPRHGLTRLKAAVRGLGGRVIDRRTTLGKALAEWRQELIQDLGGPDAVSTQEKAVVELAVKTKLLLDSIDAWLLTQPSLVNARRRTLLPVVVQRQQLADALARYLSILGLKRRRERLDLAQALVRVAGEGRGDA